MSLSNFQEVGPNIFCIDLHTFGRQRVCSYLILGDNCLTIMDCGPQSSMKYILEAIQALGKKETDVSTILLSHIHLDHAGGAGSWVKLVPSIRVGVHPSGVSNLIDPGKLISGSASVYGAKVMADLGLVEAIPQENLFSFADEASLMLGDRKIITLETHGHAYHHYSFFDDETKLLLAGDAMGVSYHEFNEGREPIVILPTAPTQFDPDAWRFSLTKIKSYAPVDSLLTHFGRHSSDKLFTQLFYLIDRVEQIAVNNMGAEDIDKATVDSLIGLYNDYYGLNETKEGRLEHDFFISSQGLAYYTRKLIRQSEKS